MADSDLNGVTTPNITTTPVSDSVVVNRGGSTKLQSTSDLATQMAGSGALASALNALALAVGATYVRTSLAALNAIVGETDGQIGIAIVGSDRGVYESVSGVWVFRSGLPSDVGEAAAEAAAAAALASSQVAQAAATDALTSKNATDATEGRINASTAMITNYRGAWTTAATYAVRDTVLQSGVEYICTVAHTAGTFATDLAAPKWQIFQGAKNADLADQINDALGAGKVGYRGTTVNGQIALQHRRPRKTFAKLYAAAAGPTALKIVQLGDSLAPMKLQHFRAALDRKFGGTNVAYTNTAGNTAGGGQATAGSDMDAGTTSGVTAITGDYNYWPTGAYSSFAAGASQAYVTAGATPLFSKIRVFYIKEPGAGTLTINVGGTDVATVAAADTAVSLGVLEYTQAFGQAVVTIKNAGAVTRVLFVHKETGLSGVELFSSMSIGGLSLASATGNAQVRAIWQAAIAACAPDLVTFEMDDDFGDAGTGDASWAYLKNILLAACPIADKVVIGSTPRAANDNLKLRSSGFLRGQCALLDTSWIFFDTYYLIGSYADQIAIFGSDDGTHPAQPAQAFAAEILFGFLGFASTNLGLLPRAVNDPSKASKLASLTSFGIPSTAAGVAPYVEVDSNAFQSFWRTNYAFAVAKTDGTCKFQISYNGSYPTVLPFTVTYDSPTGTYKRAIQAASGSIPAYTLHQDTSNAKGFQNLSIGLIRLAAYTRSELLALPANSMAGTLAWCSDATPGKGIAVARGNSPTDWVMVGTNVAI